MQTNNRPGVDIPDGAVHAAVDLSYRGQELSFSHAKKLLELAAPLVVASELERIAKAYRLLEGKFDTRDEFWAGKAEAYSKVTDALAARAKQLRGEA